MGFNGMEARQSVRTSGTPSSGWEWLFISSDISVQITETSRTRDRRAVYDKESLNWQSGHTD